MGMLIKNAQDLQEAYEQGKYSSVGGYPLYFVLEYGEALCVECANEQRLDLQDALKEAEQGYKGQWLPYGFEANWEDPELFCCHCGERIESAYAEPEEEGAPTEQELRAEALAD